jgi:thiosulfate/3-mercaptopyruvate sulfurtransferase
MSPYHTIIDATMLATQLKSPDWVIVDCRFSLTDVEAGRSAYLSEHIPGAVYAHLDEDLSGPPTTDQGRHPLPPPERLATVFSRMGIGARTQVIAYDDAGGALAARLWWMLRYMQHDAVAVVNGGWRAWREAGLPVASGEERNEPSRFQGRPREAWLVRMAEVPAAGRLIDAREPSRYRGEQEPIDPIAGHIRGAVNYHYRQNLDDRDQFLPPDRLREQLMQVYGGIRASEVTHYCGSGVTACHNLLAQAIAGMPPGRLYVGSWSEWSRRRSDR